MSDTPSAPDPTPAPSALAVADVAGRAMLTIEQVEANRAAIVALMERVMRPDVHYGKVPGCGDKPTLLQPGAQALLQLFNCGPRFELSKRDLERGHRLVEVKCVLVHNASGRTVGEGVGVCTTMEKKYRYRKLDRACPECGQANIRKSKSDRGGWYCWAKTGGCGANFEDGDQRIESQQVGEVEYDNPFDYYNTVEKIACKRAMVHAACNITGASEIFTQDVEDDPDRYGGGQPEPRQEQPRGRQPTRQQPAQGRKPVENRAPAKAPEQPAPKPKPIPGSTGKALIAVQAVEVAATSKANGRNAKKYAVVTGGGKKVFTWSESLAKVAKDAMKPGHLLDITFKIDDRLEPVIETADLVVRAEQPNAAAAKAEPARGTAPAGPITADDIPF